MSALFLDEVPESVSLPYALLSHNQSRVESQTTGFALMRSQITISCWADLASDAEILGRTVREAFEGAQLVVQGQPVLHVLSSDSLLHLSKQLGPQANDMWSQDEIFDILWVAHSQPAGIPLP